MRTINDKTEKFEHFGIINPKLGRFFARQKAQKCCGMSYLI